jgi:hypothetical protein
MPSDLTVGQRSDIFVLTNFNGPKVIGQLREGSPDEPGEAHSGFAAATRADDR